MSVAYDIIVVGAGHAGIEAALAAARSGCRTLMLTLNAARIGQMSCNPAIGGIGKGHLVREIDALGGEMGRAIDACGIQFRRLNMRKGPAVQASRAQADKSLYRARMKRVIESTPGLTLRQGEVVDLIAEGDCIGGVITREGARIQARAVVLTTGTFLEGLMHVGGSRKRGGRAGDPSSRGLSKALERLGLQLGRLKTGTCPRLDRRTINFGRLEKQLGDDPPPLFSFESRGPSLEQVCCYLTYTNAETHEIIRREIASSPMYSGAIRSRGPRYCPSIEDKVMKFPERERHRIFLEPEGLTTVEIYPNGISTALPYPVQREFVATITGLEKAVILRPGYAIEYDYVLPTQLGVNLETYVLLGLFLAGQINGTTGYEEAAAQGLMAGINATRYARGEPDFVLERDEAYIGVLLDDLVTRGIDGEPYRMFTSRAEYRLLLREDNADLRLGRQAEELGLLGKERLQAVATKEQRIAETIRLLQRQRILPSHRVNTCLEGAGESPLSVAQSAYELLRRPKVSYAMVGRLANLPALSAELQREVEISIKYDGYIRRQQEEVERVRGLERTLLPEDLPYDTVQGLSREAREKLNRIRPRSLGQVGRISGLTPAALSALAVHLKRSQRA